MAEIYNCLRTPPSWVKRRKCLCQVNNGMALVAFDRDCVDHNHHSLTCRGGQKSNCLPQVLKICVKLEFFAQQKENISTKP